MSQEQRLTRVKQRFNEGAMGILKASDEEQTGLRDYVSSHGGFSENEMSTLQFDTIDAFNKIWNVTVDNKSKFDASHERGIKRVAEGLQSPAVTACIILQHMGPMLQLVKDFGAPYGGMAIGTISFLFMIVYNRAKMESDISEILSQIKDRVAGLGLYRHIFNDDHELDHQLQIKIANTYRNFISFCIEAIKYYSGGSTRRWIKALWGLSRTLNDRALGVQKAFVDIRLLGGELLNKNVDNIKRQLYFQTQKIEVVGVFPFWNTHTLTVQSIEQTKKIGDLEDRIKQLQNGQNSTRLHEVRKLLGLEMYSPQDGSDMLLKYRGDLNHVLDYEWTDVETMRGPRLEKFKNHSDFQTWRNSSHSCMLVLTGYNDRSFYWHRMCWLSSIALDIVESLKSEKSDPFAFHILGLQDDNLLPSVLSPILLQLLMSNPQVLQDDKQYDDLRVEIETYRAVAKAEQSTGERRYGNTVLQLQKVALKILNMFDEAKPIWIILDRAEKCKSDKKNHRTKLMETLAHMVRKAAVKVRILTVVNGYDWGVDADDGDDWKRNNERGDSNEQKRVVILPVRQYVVN